MNESQPPQKTKQVEKLVELAYSYNHQFEDEKALAAIEEALALKPNDEELLEQKAIFLWNVTCADAPEKYLAFCNDCLTNQVGSELYFRFHKALVLHEMAYELKDGKSTVVDPLRFIAAIKELRKVKEISPHFVSIAEDKDWVASGWEEHFEGLMDFPEYHEIVNP